MMSQSDSTHGAIRLCRECGKPLAQQAKSEWCKRHRHKNPLRKAAVNKAKQKRRKQTMKETPQDVLRPWFESIKTAKTADEFFAALDPSRTGD
jgi:ribosome-binding protein aMBF1 (putative translation factor)